MDLKLSVINITIASNFMTLIVLTILFFGMDPSEIQAQGANTTNATNSTAASAGEVSPITVVMPTGSAAANGGGGMSQIQ
jgi:hypothetical protein